MSLSLAGYLQENAFFDGVEAEARFFEDCTLSSSSFGTVFTIPFETKKSQHLIAVSSFGCWILPLLRSTFQGCRHLDLRFRRGFSRSWLRKMEHPWHISLEGRLNSKQSL